VTPGTKPSHRRFRAASVLHCTSFASSKYGDFTFGWL